VNSTSYNYSTSLSVYDSLGTEHSIQYYFVKEDPVAAANTWSVYAFMDGTDPGFLTPGVTGNQIDLGGATAPVIGGHVLTFDLSGNLLTGAIGGNQLAPIDLTASGALPLSLTMDFTGSSQFAGNSGVNFVSQDGVQSASLVNVNISDDGVISGRYSNGVNKPLQQLVLVTFRNPQALAPIGQNQWAMTIDAGDETINAPGMGIAGTLQAQAVEDSTTDLTAELVNLIIAQRLYQANAQSISAQNTILQTLVNLR
jgi:flagellar hook protein FlgE